MLVPTLDDVVAMLKPDSRIGRIMDDATFNQLSREAHAFEVKHDAKLNEAGVHHSQSRARIYAEGNALTAKILDATGRVESTGDCSYCGGAGCVWCGGR